MEGNENNGNDIVMITKDYIDSLPNSYAAKLKYWEWIEQQRVNDRKDVKNEMQRKIKFKKERQKAKQGNSSIT